MRETQKKPSLSFEDKLKNTYPIQYFVTLGIITISILFVGICLAYLLSQSNWNWKNFKFPKVFLVSTVLLGISSYTIEQAVKFFINDDYKHYKDALLLTFALGFLFCILQCVGWFQLYSSGIYIAGKPDGSYLYLLTSLHAIHLLVGMAVMAVLFVNVKFKLKDQVAQLLYFSDTYQLVKLKQIAKYWHFVDVLWILLLLFFLFNQKIKVY